MGIQLHVQSFQVKYESEVSHSYITLGWVECSANIVVNVSAAGH